MLNVTLNLFNTSGSLRDFIHVKEGKIIYYNYICVNIIEIFCVNSLPNDNFFEMYR